MDGYVQILTVSILLNGGLITIIAAINMRRGSCMFGTDGSEKASNPIHEKGYIIIDDIPVICAECNFASFGGKYIRCEAVNKTCYNAKPKWCPIKPLSESGVLE